MLFRKLVKYPNTLDGMKVLIDSFLENNGFPVDGAHRQAAASIMQTYPQSKDSFEPALLARQLRKAKANELLFYIIRPEREPQPEPTPESTDGQEGTGATPSAVDPQAQG